MSDPIVLVAVGANLPGPWGRPVETCRRAVLELGRLPGLRVTAVSRWYRSAAWPPSDQPDYANGVVRLSGAVEPADLLRRLQAIEQAGGRVRGMRDAARTLDLDIIDIGGQRRAAPDPVLPHPRARDRAFVLLPLRDVAPDWVEPGSERSVASLLADLRELADLQDGCGAAVGQLDWPTPYI